MHLWKPIYVMKLTSCSSIYVHLSYYATDIELWRFWISDSWWRWGWALVNLVKNPVASVSDRSNAVLQSFPYQMFVLVSVSLCDFYINLQNDASMSLFCAVRMAVCCVCCVSCMFSLFSFKIKNGGLPEMSPSHLRIWTKLLWQWANLYQ